MVTTWLFFGENLVLPYEAHYEANRENKVSLLPVLLLS
jgi:hypothetical protein